LAFSPDILIFMAVGLLLFKYGCKLILNKFNTFLIVSLLTTISHSSLMCFLTYSKFFWVSFVHFLTYCFCDICNLHFRNLPFGSYNPTNPRDSQLLNQLESVRSLTLNIIINSLILCPGKVNLIDCALCLTWWYLLCL
jgi:hypothetical protein